MSALRELFALYDIKVDDKELTHAQKHMGEFKETLLKVGEAIAAAFVLKEVAEFVEGQIKLGAELEHTAQRLGVTTDELQLFQYAAQLAGVSTDEASTALRFLNKNIGEAATGNEAAVKTFAGLGVAVTDAGGRSRPVLDVLGDVADHVKAIGDPAKATATAMALFGRSGAALIPILNQGRDGVSKLSEEFEALGGGMSEEFVESAGEAHKELIKNEVAMQALKSAIVGAVMPAVQSFVTGFRSAIQTVRFLVKETGVVRTGLEFLGGAIVVGGIWKLAAAIAAAETSLGALMLEFAAIAAPLIGLALLYIAFDEINTMMRGGKSILGELLDKYYGVGTAAKFTDDLRDSWQKLTDTWDASKPILKDVGSAIGTTLLEALKAVKDAVLGVFNSFGQFGNFLGELKEGKSIAEAWRNSGKVHIDDRSKGNETWAYAREGGEKDGLGNYVMPSGPGGADVSSFAGGQISDHASLAAPGEVEAIIRDRMTEIARAAYEAQNGAYTPTLPRASESTPPDVQQNNTTTINVSGGVTNAETGRTVADAVKQTNDQNLTSASEALSSGFY